MAILIVLVIFSAIAIGFAIRQFQYDKQVGGFTFFSSRRPELNTRIQWALFVGALIGTLTWYGIHPQKPFVHPHIKAAAYVWPVGCPPGNYTYDTGPLQSIPPLCADKKYLFSNEAARNYGFDFNDKHEHYYRIKNSLMRLSCRHDIFENKDECTVRQDIKDSYYQ